MREDDFRDVHLDIRLPSEKMPYGIISYVWADVVSEILFMAKEIRPRKTRTLPALKGKNYIWHILPAPLTAAAVNLLYWQPQF